jgi:hypothetical protein
LRPVSQSSVSFLASVGITVFGLSVGLQGISGSLFRQFWDP